MKMIAVGMLDASKHLADHYAAETSAYCLDLLHGVAFKAD